MPAPAPDRAEYVICRTLGHAWDQIPVASNEVGPGGTDVWLWLRCTRCTTERHDGVNPFSGAVDRRRYVYPGDYHRSRDESLARDDWRRAYLVLTGVVGTRERRRRSA